MPAFDQASASWDNAEAGKLAHAIIHNFGNPFERGAVRLILAARAFLTHSNVALVDRLFQNGKDETLGDRLERFFLTLDHEATSESNEQILKLLLHEKGVPDSVLKAWVSSRWLYQGPSQELLRDMLRIVETVDQRQAAILSREALALAFRLDDLTFVKRILSSRPELRNSYVHVLPLAAHLCSSNVRSSPSVDPARLAEFAALHEELNNGTASVMELLRDKRRSIAVVGNSPCEIGRGRGQLIDAHDVVVRFNQFSIEDQFAQDYGKKCTLHVRLPDRETDNSCSFASGHVLLNRADFVYRQRRWTNLMALYQAGVRISAFPTGFHQPLYQMLRGEPSAGIAFCALIKDLRSEVSRRSCFGFSFVDQIGKDATSAHYFKNARPSFKHRWAEEKVLFDQLTDAPTTHSDHAERLSSRESC